MANMRDVFQRLRQAGLKVRPDKCHLFCREVVFLGHVVSRTGIKPDPSNIEKVKNWPRPKDITGLRGWLGLTGFYRRYIKDYAKIAQPLLRLNHKGVEFEWSEECEHAFQTLREALISPPVLIYPNYDQPFKLYVDASGFAIGSVLAQISSDNKEHVVAYASHSLTVSERKWSTYDRELWAIVWSIRHFKHYLQFTEFTIYTDHKPLVGLRKMPLDNDPTGKRARWGLEIDPLEWSIVYKPGVSNSNADALSRRSEHSDLRKRIERHKTVGQNESKSIPNQEIGNEKGQIPNGVPNMKESNGNKKQHDSRVNHGVKFGSHFISSIQEEATESFSLETNKSKLKEMQGQDEHTVNRGYFATMG